MTDTSQEEHIQPDADASAAKMHHHDPAGFSIITNHAVETKYITITDGVLSKDERERISKMLRKCNNRRDSLMNMLKITWVGIRANA